MSLSATRNRRNQNSKYVRPLSLAEEMEERGIEWRDGELVAITDRPWELTIEDIAALKTVSNTTYGYYARTGRFVRDHNAQIEARDLVLRGKSHGAVWIADRISMSDHPTLQQATEELRMIRRINRAIRNAGIKWGEASATKLLQIGINSPIEALRFMRGFWKFSNLSRPWGSCYQIDFRVLNAAMNADVNYNKLPDWVLKTLIKKGYDFGTDRPGDIWRLVDCAKAWKWCPSLPKRIAERVGKMSIKARMLAPIAMEMCGQYASEGFWLRLQALLKLNLGQLLDRLFREHEYASTLVESLQWGRRKLTALISQYLGLPQGVIDLDKAVNLDDCLEQIALHGDAKTVVNAIFKCNGKATIAAFKNALPEAWQYARYLAVGDADLLQKYFGLKQCLPFYPEAIPFLQSLHPSAALRMVQTLEYSVRGQSHPVSDYLVKDTGMMFENLRNRENLGRVRCWLSAHEEIARRFIAEQPDEILPVNPAFRPIDGLCAIDGSWELQVPKSTCTLKIWGNLLSHCVGGYGPAVKSGRSVIVGVTICGVVKYTIEMRQMRQVQTVWECQQFYGLRNSSPSRQFYNEVMQEIHKSLRQ